LCSALFFSSSLAPPAIYTLSLHDALPIFAAHDYESLDYISQFPDVPRPIVVLECLNGFRCNLLFLGAVLLGDVIQEKANCSESRDRKSTRLNSSHVEISYAVFCLKKKKKQ